MLERAVGVARSGQGGLTRKLCRRRVPGPNINAAYTLSTERIFRRLSFDRMRKGSWSTGPFQKLERTGHPSPVHQVGSPLARNTAVPYTFSTERTILHPSFTATTLCSWNLYQR